MNHILEGKHVEQPVLDWCKKRGIMHRKMNGLGFRGWPDRLFILPSGRVVWIEFKRPGGKLTPLQEAIHAKLEALGHHVHVIDTKNAGAETLLRALATGTVPA